MLTQAQPSWAPPPPPQKSNTMLIVAIVLIVVVVVAVIAGILVVGFVANRVSNVISGQQVVTLVNGVITVQPGHYNYYWMTIPAGATIVRVTGTFTVSGGSGNVEVLVMDQSNYVSWTSGQHESALYDSGQVTTGTISASLMTSGTYYLVYSKDFYSATSVNVQTTAYLYYIA